MNTYQIKNVFGFYTFILVPHSEGRKKNNITKATSSQPKGIYKKPLNFTATAVTESIVK